MPLLQSKNQSKPYPLEPPLPGVSSLPLVSIGSFSNDDGDGNENVKNKNNRLNNQNNNSARALHFLVHFFAVTARLGREIS